MANKILDGIMGLVVGDALGVPVEFQTRESLRRNPVKGMRAYGTYNQPAGTWSDDSSMTLALLDSLKGGLDYEDIMDKFLLWFESGEYTPYGLAFDIGIATSQALGRYRAGASPLEAGGSGERDNGNGSLMRILPLLYYLQENYGRDFTSLDGAFEIIHRVSSLTHRHKRSLIACGIYLAIANELSTSDSISKAVERGLYLALSYYRKRSDYVGELAYFSRLEDKDFGGLSEDEIRSSGYVVDTLEASIWCIVNTKSYGECVLRAVNLGKDTDTTGAVVGGLAGLYYGYGAIPSDWLGAIARRDYVEGLCNELFLIKENRK
ncbi:MAG: ADP-ribosylglycohydrolase [Synergistaceae bacterium]|nr:ADP-ribosylglycohydrolase [Synergistaceae bacterium]